MNSHARRQFLLRLIASGLTFASGLSGGDAFARRGRGRGGDDDDDDHVRAWRHRGHGEIRPLEELLLQLPPEVRSGLIEVELDSEDGIPIYELKYIDQRGWVIELEVDARTGAILKMERD